MMQLLNGKYLFKKLCTPPHTLFCILFCLLIDFQDCSNAAFSAGGSSVKFLPGFDGPLPSELETGFQDCSNAASSVKFLPGFDGPLPFDLETGYIGVGESEDVQLFYYFIKSEGNPTKDPLLLWFSGGPGCSSLFGLLYEIGPIKFEGIQYHQEGFPKLVLNPYSWTQVASIIFIDLPVGTGFSYARNTKAAQSDVLQSSDHAHEFIRKWLVDHPQFVSNQVYVGGDSYSGIIVPIITQLISDGNDIGFEPKIVLKGYVLGNPKSSPNNADYKIPYAHSMGLISDELFESLNEACRGKFQDIDHTNRLCLQNMKTFNELLRDIDPEHILEPNCPYDSRPRKLLGESRYQSDLLNLEIRKEEGSPIKCRFEGYKLSNRWANDKSVQEAIHIRKGTTGEWMRCKRDLPFKESVTNVVPYHANLSIKGFRSLIYSGDHDPKVPFISTEAWIKSLNYSIVDDWRPWIVDGQVAGYTRTFANRMTFATVKGAGHTAPSYKPVECRAMFERWISYRSH